ncbi:MAG: alpha/beta fold hydrolase [Actinomycetales bacterium]|nr:alpha/beta fold hydrolase [Actinomycetales bacterium]
MSGAGRRAAKTAAAGTGSPGTGSSGTPSAGTRAARIAAGVGIGALAIVGAAAAATAALSVVAARTVLTPPSRRVEDVPIRRVDLRAGLIVLGSNPESRMPGEYSFWFDQVAGHARVGEIIAQTPSTVTRRLLGVDFGDLTTARRGRMSGWFYLHPSDLDGVAWSDVEIPTPLGAAPAWYVPADASRVSEDWAILVHGRAVQRPETLRAVPPFRAEGYDCLVVSYRNDGEAPRSHDYRYALGDREWHDVDAAIGYALAHGAKRVVLMGWSMGGATVLQAMSRSAHRDAVQGVVLESPVVDWITTLDFQAKAHRMPWPVRLGALTLIRARWGRVFTGLAEPLDLARLDFVTRAAEIDRPVLILHSDDDGFVPSAASRALALARPDLVSFEEFQVARHVKLWNYDRDRWEAAIRVWLGELSGARRRRSRAETSTPSSAEA